jgi:hypothetical protein
MTPITDELFQVKKPSLTEFFGEVKCKKSERKRVNTSLKPVKIEMANALAATAVLQLKR